MVLSLANLSHMVAPESRGVATTPPNSTQATWAKSGVRMVPTKEARVPSPGGERTDVGRGKGPDVP